jgi:hypothetical protein
MGGGIEVDEAGHERSWPVVHLIRDSSNAGSRGQQTRYELGHRLTDSRNDTHARYDDATHGCLTLG